ncbi:hypothetical protein OZZ08_05115 [Malaciobacter mytili]|uniref:hypothetical protein n=1 Tax=Malaciobacter mytili TaxID=603050 RepID=UPI003BAE9342
MATYFISYDLRNRRDYKTLQEELDTFGAVMILESLYCFKRNNTTTTNLRDHFKKFIDKDDGIIVSEINGWASFNTNSTPKDL